MSRNNQLEFWDRKFESIKTEAVPQQIKKNLTKILTTWGLEKYNIDFKYSDPRFQNDLFNPTSLSLLSQSGILRHSIEKNKLDLQNVKWGAGSRLERDFYDSIFQLDAYNFKHSKGIEKDNALIILDNNNLIIRIILWIKTDLILNEIPKELNYLQSFLSLTYITDSSSSPRKNRPNVSFPADCSNLLRLQILGIVRVNIANIPKNIFFLNSLKTCLIYKVGGISSPPQKILEQGLNSIRNFYQEVEKTDELDYLYEAKMVLVGRGFSGKTTIVNKLLDPEFKIEDESESTKGIDIGEWYCPIDLDKSKTFKFNIWDFGGQQKYDATHQFFITERTLYIFVTEARQESNFLDFDYWLNTVEMLSNGSPVIVVQNKIDQRRKKLPSDKYGGLFNNIISFLYVSCSDGYEETLKDLKDHIKLGIKKLPQVGDELPKNWIYIRKDLENVNKDYISYNEYKSICNTYGLNKTRADFLSRYFHDLGIILHHSKDPLLKNLVVVNPDWAVDGVYKVLDNRKVEENNGRFSRNDLKEIWDNSKYEEKQDELVALMKNYGICFEFGNSGEFMAPELLSPNPPLEFRPLKGKSILEFVYKYEFMPAGLLTRLIVRLHRYIYQNLFWKHGLVIKFEDNVASILEDEVHKTIKINIKGDDNKQITLAIIRKELLDIYEDFNRKIKYEELIPCNCNPCKEEFDNPHLFKWRTIKLFLSKGKSHIPCELSAIDVDLKVLAGEIESVNKNTILGLEDSLEHPGISNVNITKADSSKSLFNIDNWSMRSLIGGLSVALIVFLLLTIPSEYFVLRVSILAGAFVAGLLLLRNPITRYMRGFWGVFSAWNALNLLPTFKMTFRASLEDNQSSLFSFFELISEQVEIFFNLGLIILMVVLLILDYRIRKD